MKINKIDMDWNESAILSEYIYDANKVQFYRVGRNYFIYEEPVNKQCYHRNLIELNRRNKRR